MSTFTMTFDTNNADFRNEDGTLHLPAIARILTETAARMDTYGIEPGWTKNSWIRDLNGNTIGQFIIEEDPLEES